MLLKCNKNYTDRKKNDRNLYTENLVTLKLMWAILFAKYWKILPIEQKIKNNVIYNESCYTDKVENLYK